MQYIYFTKKNTSEENIDSYLKYAGDTQKFHRPPYFVMPGMFYLKMLSEHIDRGISGTEIEMLDMRKYPLNGKIDVEQQKGIAAAAVLDDKGKVLAKIVLQLDDKPELNQQRLSRVHHLAGELIEHEEDRLEDGKISAIYNRQTACFNGYQFPKTEVVVPIIGSPVQEEKNQVYPIKWISSQLKNRQSVEVGTGLADLRFIQTRVLEKIIARL